MSINERYLTIDQVLEIVQTSKPTLQRWVRQGRFPSAILLTKRTPRWKESEVADFLEGCERNRQEA